jgi:hypothetical protein
MQNTAHENRPPKVWMWLALIFVTIGALAMVIVPAYVIFPFKAQTERGLDISYALKRWSPIVTLLIAGIALALAVWLWRNLRRWWSRAFLIIPLFFVFLAVWFARQNHFEWMFNPINKVSYTTAGDAGFVEESDKVLAVEINGEAVAFPVRQLAYHHIVNSVVGGTPIVATY